MGSILGTVVADHITSGIAGLEPEQQAVAAQTLGGGSIPHIAELPDALRVIVESAYGLGVGSVFLAAVPLTVITLIAVIFLPNVQLGTLTAVQRAKEETSGDSSDGSLEAELEQVGEELLEVSEASVGVPVTASAAVIDDAAPRRSGRA